MKVKTIRKKFYAEEEFDLTYHPSNTTINIIKVDKKNRKITVGYTYMIPIKFIFGDNK